MLTAYQNKKNRLRFWLRRCITSKQTGLRAGKVTNGLVCAITLVCVEGLQVRRFGKVLVKNRVYLLGFLPLKDFPERVYMQSKSKQPTQ